MDVKAPAKVTDEIQLECKLTRDAIIEFLTNKELNWTVSALKASIGVEELKTTAPLAVKVDTSVKTAVNTAVNTTVTGPVNTYGAMVPGAKGLGKGQQINAPGVGTGMCTEPLVIRKSGAKHGAMLLSKGYAYIGQDPQATDFQATDAENDFTKVRLYKDKIKKNLL